MIKIAKAYEKELTIPTYGVGQPEKNPMFFENRVYQGSSGRVYPYPVIEKIEDEKTDKIYRAVVLENDFLYVVVLPELGGRIYTCYDKTNGYDFVYHNKVVKPALVGLLGPWISGGIEFNWPQHHRPTTFSPVDYRITEQTDGSASVFVGEIEAMFGLKHTTEIRLYPDRAYLELNTAVYNPGALRETFLWWANPAFHVNDRTATVMPPDVAAVADHGKRATSAFPIARGEYYKMDYSAGVDISRYKNIPVPTSFMACRSDFDFVGGYDYGRGAGLLHVADHRVAPGKKQWTWGSGDFGAAWDRNLTDENGPYVELMTGCFTDNQPDFTFIEPHETKRFTQYFLPYRAVGKILNADENFVFGCENGRLTVYSSIETEAEITVMRDGNTVFRSRERFAPTEDKTLTEATERDTIRVAYDGRSLTYDFNKIKKFDVPDPATACPPPEECATTEELYLMGTHVEQYRHATRRAEDYFKEGLRRDPSDLRLNDAYGLWLLRRCRVRESLPYFISAIKKATVKNDNPQNTAPFYHAGVAYFLLKDYENASDFMGKCLWGSDSRIARYFLAAIDRIRGDARGALGRAKEIARYEAEDTVALNLAGRTLFERGDAAAAIRCFEKAAEIDPLDAAARFECGDGDALTRVPVAELRRIAGNYILEGDVERATELIKKFRQAGGECDAVTDLIEAYSAIGRGASPKRYLQEASEKIGRLTCFANGFAEFEVLSALSDQTESEAVCYLLGNLLYDAKNYERAAELWERALKIRPDFATPKRNLALYSYNKKKDAARAVEYLESAYRDDTSDARILTELNELYRITGVSEEARYALLHAHSNEVFRRDDLYLDMTALTEASGAHEAAYERMIKRKFHPWEGGEGKVTALYKKINVSLARAAADRDGYGAAREILERCFQFPENLGEGKLILDGDNDAHYLMGELAERFDRTEEAKASYEAAASGRFDMTDGAYYNDNPVEYAYYAALANVKLARNGEAERIAKSMRKYCDLKKDAPLAADYFAVSLPDMLIWERDPKETRREYLEKIETYATKIEEAIRCSK